MVPDNTEITLFRSDTISDKSIVENPVNEIETLRKQLEALSLLVNSRSNQMTRNQNTTFQKRYIYCDDPNHMKNQCALLTKDLHEGLVMLGEHSKVMTPDKTLVPFNFNKGGMHALIMSKRDMNTNNNSTFLMTSNEKVTLGGNALIVEANFEEYIDDNKEDIVINALFKKVEVL